MKTNENMSASTAYKRMMCDKIMGDGNYNPRILKDNYDLMAFLQSIEFLEFSVKSETHEQLVRKIGVKGHGEYLKSYEAMVAALKEYRVPYYLESNKVSYTKPNGKKSKKIVWKVVPTKRDLPTLTDELT